MRAIGVVLSLLLFILTFSAIVVAQKAKRNRVHIYWCVDPASGLALPCKFARKPERRV